MSSGYGNNADPTPQEQVDDCMMHCDGLTDGELQFIDKAALLLDTGQGLTRNQQRKLEEAWQKTREAADRGQD